MNYQQIEKHLGRKLSSRRLLHSRNVSQTAGELAERYGADPEKARLAGLLHDCARDLRPPELTAAVRELNLKLDPVELWEPVLLHAPVGAAFLPLYYGIDDPDICRAVRVHTVGSVEMSLLDKVVYLADYIEPGREFSGVVVVRKLAENNLDQALFAAVDQSLRHVIRCGALVHPDTMLCRNALLMQGNQGGSRERG